MGGGWDRCARVRSVGPMLRRSGALPRLKKMGTGGGAYVQQNMLPMRVHGMPYAYYLRVYSTREYAYSLGVVFFVSILL
jgi:hypothetical protein